MKSLENMDNVDRAYLFAKLFPEHTAQVVTFLVLRAAYYRKHEKQIREDSEGNLIHPNMWFELVGNIERSAKNQGKHLYSSARVFADQLFDGYNAIYSTHCLVQFAQTAECPKDVALAIQLLFGGDQLGPTDPKQTVKD